MSKVKELAELTSDPIRWVADQFSDIGFQRVFGWMEDMTEVNERGPELLGRQMIKRGEKPEMIRMPWGVMAHFPNTAKHDAITYSSQGQLNPQAVMMSGGDTMWRVRNPDRFLITAGIDVKDSGNPCHSGNCVPRAIYGVTDGQHSYDEITSRLETFNEKGRGGTMMGEALLYLQEYMPSRNFRDLPIPGLRDDMSYEESGDLIRDPQTIKNVYDLMQSSGVPRGILNIRTTNDWTGHAISYMQGRQHILHPLEKFGVWNTNEVSSIIHGY